MSMTWRAYPVGHELYGFYYNDKGELLKSWIVRVAA